MIRFSSSATDSSSSATKAPRRPGLEDELSAIDSARGALASIADAHGCTAMQVALAWVLSRPGVIAIPKAGRPEHVRENAGAGDIVLSAEELQALDQAFAPPKRKRPLEML